MTHYLMAVWMDETGTQLPPEEEREASYAATGEFNDRLRERGVFVFAGGLHDASTATVVDGRGASVVTVDGPFSEAKEQLGGFWVVQAPDLDAALALAAEGSRACGARVEVRPFEGIVEA